MSQFLEKSKNSIDFDFVQQQISQTPSSHHSNTSINERQSNIWGQKIVMIKILTQTQIHRLQVKYNKTTTVSS